MRVPGWMVIVFVALLIAGAAGGLFVGMRMFGGTPPPRDSVAVEAQGEPAEADFTHTFDPGPFTVNLGAGAQSRFVRTSLTITTDRAGEARLQERRPQVRDVIISIFREKTPVDLEGAEGMERLREELRQAVNEKILRGQGQVGQVYFTEFVVQ